MSYSTPALGFVVLSLLAAGCAQTLGETSSGDSPVSGSQLKSFSSTISADLDLRFRTAQVPTRKFRRDAPEVEAIVVDVSCDRGDHCTAIDRGQPAGQSIVIAAEAGAHLSGDLLASGLRGAGTNGVAAVRVVCEKANGDARCVTSAALGDAPRDTLWMITGVGSLVTASHTYAQQHTGGSVFYDVYSYDLRYEDVNGYFGAATSVGATVVSTTHVAHHGGLPSAPSTSSTDQTLNGASGIFTGQFRISLSGQETDSETDLDRLAVAFSSAGRWDSNAANNYEL